ASPVVAVSCCFSFSRRSRHTRFSRDWSSDVCSSDLFAAGTGGVGSGAAEVNRDADVAFGGEDLPGGGSGGYAQAVQRAVEFGGRSEERRVGKECRSREAQSRG